MLIPLRYALSSRRLFWSSAAARISIIHCAGACGGFWYSREIRHGDDGVEYMNKYNLLIIRVWIYHQKVLHDWNTIWENLRKIIAMKRNRYIRVSLYTYTCITHFVFNGMRVNYFWLQSKSSCFTNARSDKKNCAIKSVRCQTSACAVRDVWRWFLFKWVLRFNSLR